MLAATSTTDYEVARFIAARMLGITPEEAVRKGHSIEVSKILQRLAREGIIEFTYTPGRRCAYRRVAQVAVS